MVAASPRITLAQFFNAWVRASSGLGSDGAPMRVMATVFMFGPPSNVATLRLSLVGYTFIGVKLSSCGPGVRSRPLTPPDRLGAARARDAAAGLGGQRTVEEAARFP